MTEFYAEILHVTFDLAFDKTIDKTFTATKRWLTVEQYSKATTKLTSNYYVNISNAF